jgi:hypothetical protein
MPEVEGSPPEYPNQALGISGNVDTNAGGVNQLTAPLLLATAAGVTGSIFNSGSGAPGITNSATPRVPGNVGDFYFRAAGTGVTGIYKCTVAGNTTAVVWSEVV